jgi:preprotein translocase subunit SecF
VIVFMLIYYRMRSGLIADIALGLNLLLLLGTLSMFDATLTLPGIAGILLTAGMAVDANILIYERIREEAARGAAIRQAIQTGYDRAFWTIFDANLTTALTAVVLMWAGTGPIKGFGVTLTIGIVVSMFTALFVTRALYGFFVAKEIVTEVKFRSLFARPTFDFFAARKKSVPISVALILTGWMVFVFRGDEKYGIDFTGGTVLQMRLKDPIEKNDVRKIVEGHFGTRVPVEVQRVGAKIERPGSTELGREWLLRTRMVSGGKPTGKETSSSGFSLLSPAYGQDAPAQPEARPARRRRSRPARRRRSGPARRRRSGPARGRRSRPARGRRSRPARGRRSRPARGRRSPGCPRGGHPGAHAGSDPGSRRGARAGLQRRPGPVRERGSDPLPGQAGEPLPGHGRRRPLRGGEGG